MLVYCIYNYLLIIYEAYFFMFNIRFNISFNLIPINFVFSWYIEKTFYKNLWYIVNPIF